LQSLLLKIDVTEIIVHKADQPNTVVDFFDAYSLTCERSAEIYFLFENANPSAVGNQNCPIVERIGEFSDAPIWPRGSLIDFDGALHIESLMWALVVKLVNEDMPPRRDSNPADSDPVYSLGIPKAGQNLSH